MSHEIAPQPRRWGTPEYNSWKAMRSRCLSPKHEAYGRYTGRGITICERWLNSFDAFLADMGPRPEGLTLERVDNERGYEPANCVWATRKAQAVNRRFDPVKAYEAAKRGNAKRFAGHVSQWVKQGISRSTYYRRKWGREALEAARAAAEAVQPIFSFVQLELPV